MQKIFVIPITISLLGLCSFSWSAQYTGSSGPCPIYQVKKSTEKLPESEIRRLFYQAEEAYKKYDYDQARFYYEQSAKQGHIRSVYNLGLLYYEGNDGIPKDYAKASACFKQAAKYGDIYVQTKAKKLLNDIFWFETEDMWDNGVDAYKRGNYTKAYSYFKQAAKRGDKNAQDALGTMYFYGLGVKKNNTKARIYFEQAIKQGNVGSKFNLGTMYYEGHGVAKNTKKGMAYFEQAAEQGNMNARFRLGQMYDDGENVTQDYAKARFYYEQAAEQKNADAHYNLGVMYDKGHGVAQDAAKARSYYEQALSTFKIAAVSNDSYAQYKTGVMYEKGQGVAQDDKQARYYFEESAKQGNLDAKKALKRLDKNKGVTEQPKKVE